MAEKPSNIASGTQQHQLSRRDPDAASPFRRLERFADEMDRMFGEFGFGRAWNRAERAGGVMTWAPRIDVTQRNNELVIRTDLPGMSKDDVKVDVTDDAITIQGERHREHEEEHGGVYRSERSYGSFYREIPVPDGAITDQAKAIFKDGVLEITMPAPPEQVTQGRRLEISDASTKSK